MTDSYADRVREQLEVAVRVVRQETLEIFVRELMIALAKENYRLDDLLDGLTLYSQRRSDWSEVTKCLAAAAVGVRAAKRKLIDK